MDREMDAEPRLNRKISRGGGSRHGSWTGNKLCKVCNVASSPFLWIERLESELGKADYLGALLDSHLGRL